MPGFLGTDYLTMVGAIDANGWWPNDLTGLSIADVGCFSGGVTAILASRGATVTAIDEIPEHIEQCKLVLEALDLSEVRTVEASGYRVPEAVGEGTLDGIFLGGVLYHYSDMLTGLMTLRRALKPGAWLVLETNADEDEKRSYANFGRFYAGMWWQPSVAAVRDLLEFAGFDDIETQVFRRNRLIARAVRSDREPPFTRGLPYDLGDVHDDETRTLDAGVMEPATSLLTRIGMTIRAIASRLQRSRS